MNSSELEDKTPNKSPNQNAQTMELAELVSTVDREIESTYGQEELLLPIEDFEFHGGEKERDKFLTISISARLFALPVSYIAEITTLGDVTPIPKVPSWLLGITNLSGELLSVISLAKFFDLDSTKSDMPNQPILILEHPDDEIKTAITVDKIGQILYVEKRSISPFESTKNPSHNKYILGIYKAGAEQINLFNAEAFLNSDEVRKFD